jgi:NAD(P)-dependent dehydrogenase (short-subunit alcohol dehydrogenase family)
MADDHLSLGLVADVTDHAAVRRAAEAVRAYFGHCDIIGYF